MERPLARSLRDRTHVVDGVVYIPFPGQSSDTLSGHTQGQKEAAALREFVAGPENRLAVLAVRSILKPNGQSAAPVFFYGPSGTGKSHLARGLAATWKAQCPRQPVVWTTAVDFARELADALETQTLDEVRARYRRAALLVLDDLHHLEGKQAAQREMRQLLDSLGDRGRRVVVTARESARQLTRLMPGLRSRLAAGLSVPLLPPGPEARLAILHRGAATRHMQLPQPVALILANGLPATVPKLLGALTQLQMAARLGGTAVDPAAARRYLVQNHGAREPALPEIAAAAARFYCVKLGDLRSPSRRRTLVTARSVAMYLARTLTQDSLETIGRYFGGRDHTTVSHDCRKIGRLMQTEPATREAVLQLQQELRAA